MEFIARGFYGDYTNQNRLFKLIRYYRPRHVRNPRVSIHRKVWRKIIGSRGEREFKAILRDKGILATNESYSAGHYSKSYHINGLSTATPNEMLKDANGRAVQNYKEALKIVYGSVADIVSKTGISSPTLYQKARRL